MNTIIQEIFLQWRQAVGDSGPLYQETQLDRFPVEPFNTVSNLIFLASIIYFSVLIYKSNKKHWFLSFCMPFYFIGFVGGTIYHATRSHEVWLLMDWVPIVLLCLACSMYFLLRASATWISKAVLLFIILALNLVPRWVPIPEGFEHSVGYLGTAAAVILPLLFYGRSTQWKYFGNILAAIASFALAITFRTMDRHAEVDYLFMGTHWLWHIFGGVAVFFLMRYIFLENEGVIEKVEIRPKSTLKIVHKQRAYEKP